jgi:hypothetical protein
MIRGFGKASCLALVFYAVHEESTEERRSKNIQEDVVRKLQIQLTAILLSTLYLLTGAYGQTGAASSARSLPATPLQRRLAQVREQGGRPATASTHKQSTATPLDHAPLVSASLDRIRRAQAAHKAVPQSRRLPGASVAAERYVFGRMDLATDDFPDAVAIGAFQKGGPQSLAVVTPGSNPSADTVSILLANPDGTFQAQTDYAVGVGADAIAVGDFNGDGNLDLAIASYYSASVSILLGNGDGTFQPQVQYSCVSTCNDVVAGDFNGDGKLDLAVDSYDGDELVVLLGNGDGTFKAPVGSATPIRPSYLVAGDFNGDGILDVATSIAFSDTVAVLLGNGDGTFKSAVQYVTGYEPGGVATADLRGDGKLDLVTANGSANTVSVLLGNGDGTFQNHVDYATGDGPSWVSVGDFNGDGKLDLTAANSADNTVSILLGEGNGKFKKHVDYSAGAGSSALAVGDLNGDGKLDVAVANENANTVSVLVGEGNGTFQTPENYGLGGLPGTVVIADLNGDGKLDLASENESNTVSVLLNKGAGKFGAAVNYPVGYAPYGTVAANFGNGKMDLAVTNQGEGTISVLLGNGDGTFQTQKQYPAGGEPEGIVVGDFNGTGILGLATADFYGPTTGAVLLGNGNGTFQPFIGAPGVPAYVTLIATADFRGNGTLDLAITGSVSDTVSNVYIELGNGDGTFQPPVAYPTGNGGEQVIVGDFNNDGKSDLAVVNEADNTVSVLLGNGDGTFQPQLVAAVGVEPFWLTAADFNTDGNLDLAVVNSNCSQYPCPPGTVSLLLGNGDGTFQPHVDYRFGGYAFADAAGDLSGQGGADLAVTNYLGSTVSVLLNLPVISVFPNTLNFGKETVGVKSSAQTITISNPSGTPIWITGKPAISGADATDFAETTTCPLKPKTLAPGAECSISVTFDPKATGARSATISLKDSVPGSPQVIALGGTGQ